MVIFKSKVEMFLFFNSEKILMHWVFFYDVYSIEKLNNKEMMKHFQTYYANNHASVVIRVIIRDICCLNSDVIKIQLYTFFKRPIVVTFSLKKKKKKYKKHYFYVLRKGHKINKTNTYVARRIKVIYYRKQVIQCCQCSYLLPNCQSGFQWNVISLLEESIVYQK